MIDPSFDTDGMRELTNTLVTPYPTVEKLEARVAELEASLAQKTTNWEYASRQLQQRVAQIEAFENELKANPWDFDAETLNDLARFFDITLEREYMVEVTVRFSGSVTVPMDYDIDDLENELSAEITKSYYGDANVEVDFMEEDMEISYEEV